MRATVGATVDSCLVRKHRNAFLSPFLSGLYRCASVTASSFRCDAVARVRSFSREWDRVNRAGGAGGYDLAVIGGGLIGLATARAYLLRRPDARIVVLEKEQELARHQSGRNSGVVHAGLYYPAGSLKATLCRQGRAALLRFADEHSIPYEITGKLVVALGADELPRLEELGRRGRANGLEGLRELDAGELREVEPHAAGIRALHVPETAVIDFRAGREGARRRHRAGGRRRSARPRGDAVSRSVGRAAFCGRAAVRKWTRPSSSPARAFRLTGSQR